jgi:glycerophosphoryl diester phosphodiesterase
MNKLPQISLAPPSISIVAHRGKTAGVKSENTIEAFQAAMLIFDSAPFCLGEGYVKEIATPQIEFDLRMSRDGYLIVYHDRSIDNIEVGNLDYHQLQSISQSKGFEIPLFEDILKLCRDRINLDIEIKEEGYEEQVIMLATEYLKYSNFVIKSFNDTSVKKIKDLDPHIKVGLLLGKVSGKFPIISILAQFFPEYRIMKTGADFVAPHFRLLKFGFLWRMKLLKREVYVWTVNEERRLFKLMKSKYITAIITDEPELAMKILASLQQQIGAVTQLESQDRSEQN